MITINVHPGMTISLGREGENLARKIIFDVSSWQAEYGDGKVSLVANKDGAEPYPCDITVDGSIVTWMITSSDTTQSGFGRCELHYIVGDTLVKSDMWRTYTADALGTPTPEPPEPQQAWVDKVLAAGRPLWTQVSTRQKSVAAATGLCGMRIRVRTRIPAYRLMAAAARYPPSTGGQARWC